MANPHSEKQGQPLPGEEEPPPPSPPEDKRSNSQEGPTPPPQKGRAKPHSLKEEATTTTRKTGKDQTAKRKGLLSPQGKAKPQPERKGQPHRKNLSKTKREVSANSKPKKSQPPTSREGMANPSTRRANSHQEKERPKHSPKKSQPPTLRRTPTPHSAGHPKDQAPTREGRCNPNRQKDGSNPGMKYQFQTQEGPTSSPCPWKEWRTSTKRKGGFTLGEPNHKKNGPNRAPRQMGRPTTNP